MFGSSSWLHPGKYFKFKNPRKSNHKVNPQISALDLNAEQERFNDLHYQIDYWLRHVRINTSDLIEQINTDALTILGSKISEAADLKDTTILTIDDALLDLGETNQCLIDAESLLTSSASSAGVSMSACAQQTIASLDTITNENVIPYSSYIQRRSTTASHFTLTALASHNPITEATELAAFLEEAFEGNADAWENYAKLIMESEMEYLEQLASEAVMALEVCLDSALLTFITLNDAVNTIVASCEA